MEKNFLKMKKEINKKEALNIAKELITNILKNKFDIKETLAFIAATKEENAEETILFYLKDIKKLVDELIETIEK